jgi:hypothetical protein
MREHRVIAISLFVILQATVGCHNRVVTVSTSPEAMLPGAKVGDTLEWTIPDDQTVTLWIPKGLCAPDPTPDPDGTERYGEIQVTVSKNKKLTCKVAKQATTGLSYYYEFEIKPNPAPGPTKVRKTPIPPPVTLIATSCVGCKAVRGSVIGGKGSNDPTQPQRIECDKDSDSQQTSPHVVDTSHRDVPSLEIPANIPSASWNVNGDKGIWTVTFKKPSQQLCSNVKPDQDGNYVLGNSGNLVKTCYLNSSARGNTYSYSITLSTCNQTSSTEPYTLNLDLLQ